MHIFAEPVIYCNIAQPYLELIACASNVGRKLVIVQGAAEHYYCFLPALRVQLIPNTTANHTVTICLCSLSGEVWSCSRIITLHIIPSRESKPTVVTICNVLFNVNY